MGKSQDKFGQTKCRYCDPGFYQDGLGRPGCKQCPMGKFSSLDLSFCVNVHIEQPTPAPGADILRIVTLHRLTCHTVPRTHQPSPAPTRTLKSTVAPAPETLTSKVAHFKEQLQSALQAKQLPTARFIAQEIQALTAPKPKPGVEKQVQTHTAPLKSTRTTTNVHQSKAAEPSRPSPGLTMSIIKGLGLIVIAWTAIVLVFAQKNDGKSEHSLLEVAPISSNRVLSVAPTYSSSSMREASQSDDDSSDSEAV